MIKDYLKNTTKYGINLKAYLKKIDKKPLFNN